MAVTPFRIAVPDTDLDDLRAAIARTRWPDQVDDAGWDYGTPLGYLQELVEYWADGFDWRARERELNSLPQFRTSVDAPGFEEFGLHFVHQSGVGPAPLPLVLSHGWPSTHYEYQDVVARLANPGAFGDDPADAFHVVVPSLPGYGFSDIPRRRGMTPRVMATMFAALMRELGYDRFAAAGCDWGAYVTALLGLDHPDALVGIHMGMLNFRAPDYERTAEDACVRCARQGVAERGIGIQHDPGHETPVARIRTHGLTRRARGVDRGEVAAVVRLRRRRATALHPRRAAHDDRHLLVHRDDQQRQPPLLREPAATPSPSRPASACSRPRGSCSSGRSPAPTPNIGPPPRSRAEAVYDVHRWTVPDRGLHFPAAETPDLYVEELRAFYRPLR